LPNINQQQSRHTLRGAERPQFVPPFTFALPRKRGAGFQAGTSAFVPTFLKLDCAPLAHVHSFTRPRTIVSDEHFQPAVAALPVPGV